LLSENLDLICRKEAAKAEGFATTLSEAKGNRNDRF
jgi:hypothetical protein